MVDGCPEPNINELAFGGLTACRAVYGQQRQLLRPTGCVSNLESPVIQGGGTSKVDETLLAQQILHTVVLAANVGDREQLVERVGQGVLPRVSTAQCGVDELLQPSSVSAAGVCLP